MFPSKENLWLFVHKIPANIFYFQETQIRLPFKILISNFYMFLIGMLDDEYTAIKKCVLLHYQYMTDNKQQHLLQFRESYEILKSKVTNIRFLPP